MKLTQTLLSTSPAISSTSAKGSLRGYDGRSVRQLGNQCNSGSTGLTWCESTQKCYASWEEDCNSETPAPSSFVCDGDDTMRHNLQMYSDGWLCDTDSYGVSQRFGLTGDGQLALYYDDELVWDPPQCSPGSYLTLNNKGQLRVYDENENVVWNHECLSTGMVPNYVEMREEGGFEVYYHNGGIRKVSCYVNAQGNMSGCNE